ncbi:MAG: HlyC/CorC family transporter [Anaerolineales bacterium]|nr:HlyC/CorC family transporter [Anaerolineales bacterium]
MSSTLAALAGLLVFNGLMAAARSALMGASRARLRQMVEGGAGGAARALRVAEDATPLLATIRLVQTISRFLAAGLIAIIFEPQLAGLIAGWPALAPQADTLALLALMVLAALLVVPLGELLPEAWVLRSPERWALLFAPPVAALEWLLGPVIRLVLLLSWRVTTPLAGRQLPFVTEEEIKTMVDAGEEGGVIEEEEKEMIYSIFEIGDTMAREIMVPRIDVLALDVSTPLPEALEAVLAAGHSRVPVYSGHIDNIAGLLYAKDLLRAWKDGSQLGSLRDLLRPAYFVPETKKVDKLLAELQQKRIHLAVVVDEYGGTAGIVTLEDIVEEIVGEIRDEYDVNEESLFERVSASEYIFDARIDLDDVNELLRLELPSGQSDSLGGYIYGQLGHVPTPGEKVHGGRVEFEVLTVTGRRIRQVRALRQAEEPAASAEARRGTGASPTESLNDT